MAFSYKPLFKMMVDHNMNKTQLREAVGLSPGVIAKLSKGEYLSAGSAEKICRYFHCQIGDIVEFVADEEANSAEQAPGP